MSAAFAVPATPNVAPPAPRPSALKTQAPGTPRARLKVVPGVRQQRRLAAIKAPLQARSSTPFLMLCALLLAGSLLGVLVINTSMAYSSFEMTRLGHQSRRVAQDIQIMQQSLREVENTLAARATEMGMVPSVGAVPLYVAPFAPAITEPTP